MSSAPALPHDFDPTWIEPPPRSALGTFLAHHRPRLETRLDEECAELGRGIRGFEEVLGSAVGTQGRGGGRWRPLLTLAAAEACGPALGDPLDVAVAVELTHTASLALDDLPCMDDAGYRRGQLATHRLVGSAGAILLSVGLLSRAVELLGRQPRSGGALGEDWGKTVGLMGMAGGQAMDVAAPRPMRGAQRRLHRAKSAALPAFALGAGARLAGAEPATRLGLEAFGRGLGWAYQLVDDVEDLEDDARQGRATDAPRPLSLSERILRQAHRRLARLPGLTSDGRAVLTGLAACVVSNPRSSSASEEAARSA